MGRKTLLERKSWGLSSDSAYPPGDFRGSQPPLTGPPHLTHTHIQPSATPAPPHPRQAPQPYDSAPSPEVALWVAALEPRWGGRCWEGGRSRWGGAVGGRYLQIPGGLSGAPNSDSLRPVFKADQLSSTSVALTCKGLINMHLIQVLFFFQVPSPVLQALTPGHTGTCFSYCVPPLPLPVPPQLLQPPRRAYSLTTPSEDKFPGRYERFHVISPPDFEQTA